MAFRIIFTSETSMKYQNLLEIYRKILPWAYELVRTLRATLLTFQLRNSLPNKQQNKFEVRSEGPFEY